MQPANGVARGCRVFPPGSSPVWLVAVDIGLREARRATSEDGLGFDWVGATGWSRPDAMVRAAGEAVERFSLIPQNPDPLVTLNSLTWYPDVIQACLISPLSRTSNVDSSSVFEPLAEPFDTTGDTEGHLPGRSLLIPSALVSDPSPDSNDVDASPSGAAAGPSWMFAVGRAILESIERDASLICWALRPRLPFHDSLELAESIRALPRSILVEVSVYLSKHNLRARTVLLPSEIAGVTTALTFFDGFRGTRSMLATGARAGTSLVDCVASSMREAMQVHMALIGLSEHFQPTTTPSPVIDEMSRALYCLTPAARGHYVGWLNRGMEARDVDFGALSGEQVEFSTTELVLALRRTGLRPIVADLTPRLPSILRADGWCAVRTFVLGHQPYRADDTKEWTWLLSRTADWRARLPGAENIDVRETPPHPLI